MSSHASNVSISSFMQSTSCWRSCSGVWNVSLQCAHSNAPALCPLRSEYQDADGAISFIRSAIDDPSLLSEITFFDKSLSNQHAKRSNSTIALILNDFWQEKWFSGSGYAGFFLLSQRRFPNSVTRAHAFCNKTFLEHEYRHGTAALGSAQGEIYFRAISSAGQRY